MHKEGPREAFFVILPAAPLSALGTSLSSLSLSCLPISACSHKAFLQPLGSETLGLSDLALVHLGDFQSVRQGVMEACRKALTN